MKIKKLDLIKLIKEFKRDSVSFNSDLSTNTYLQDLLKEKEQAEIWGFKLEMINDDPIYCYIGSKDLLLKMVNASNVTEINDCYTEADKKGVLYFEGDYGPVDEKVILNAKDNKVILSDNNEIISLLCNESIDSVIVYDHSSDIAYNSLTSFNICFQNNPNIVKLKC